MNKNFITACMFLLNMAVVSAHNPVPKKLCLEDLLKLSGEYGEYTKTMPKSVSLRIKLLEKLHTQKAKFTILEVTEGPIEETE